MLGLPERAKAEEMIRVGLKYESKRSDCKTDDERKNL
jgi:hypothetical protein